MKITHDKNVRLTHKRAALLDAAEFFATTLGLDAYQDVVIEIAFKHEFTKTFGAYAQVNHIAQNLLVIDFEAKINVLSLFTLAHEMIHVKQYVTGELAECGEGFQLWHGKHVEAGLKYFEEPWEIEAMQRENVLTYQYIWFRDNRE